MSRRLRISLALVVGMAALTVLVSLLLRNYIREILAVRVSYILWVVDLFLKSMPQVVCWAWLIFVLGVVIYKSLSVEKKQPPPRPAGLIQLSTRERVGLWSRHVQRAMRGNHFSWLSIGERLGELSARVVAHQQRITLREARLMVEREKIADMPDAVRECLEMRYRPIYINRVGWKESIKRLIRQVWDNSRRREWEQLPGLVRNRHLDEMEVVLSYLESQLEVDHEQ